MRSFFTDLFSLLFIYLFIHIFLLDPLVFILSFFTDLFSLFFIYLFIYLFTFFLLIHLFLFSRFLLICFFLILYIFVIYFLMYLISAKCSKTIAPTCSLQCFLFAVCDMCERQGNDADFPLWSPRRVPQMLREDDSDGCVAASVAPALRHLSCQNPTTKAERDDCRRRPSPDVSVALLCGRQVLGRSQLCFQLHHGIHQVGCTWFRVQLLRWKDVGCTQFGVSVLYGQ